MHINRAVLVRAGFVLALSTVSQSLRSQDFPYGLGVEIGWGYNQIFAKSLIPIQQPHSERLERNGFSAMPTVRLKYELPVADFITLTPFAGYNRFGGRNFRANGYKDQFWFDVIEAGLFGTYPIGSIRFGAGLKANHHFKITASYFGGAAGQVWDDRNMGWLFRRWSYDVGVRESFNFSHWNVAVESWFGVSSFQTPGLDGKAQWRQNHFRLLVGYTL